jgi:DNA-binding NtrC family response regulator
VYREVRVHNIDILEEITGNFRTEEMDLMPSRILIVDDDRAVTASLSLVMKQAGYASDCAESPDEAFSLLAQREYDLLLQDMNFSRETTGEEGLDMLRRVRMEYPDLPVILITAWGSISLAVRGMRAGASDFITKPWSNDRIVQSVKNVLGIADLRSTEGISMSRRELDGKYDFQGLIGEDPKFLRILEIAGRISTTDASVLITGESGTGKELLAEAIHRNSPKRDAAFVKVNLGGISPTLFESEMFGHTRGAFTDARYDRKGRFERADGGTIFLDEIGDLDPGCQVKLLRVLQDRTFEVLGTSHPRTVDVRVRSATNRNLHEMVEHGLFREDLLYRLNLIALHVPPLRERPGDILLLTHHFLESLSVIYRHPNLSVTDGARKWLQKLPWPGNVRELKQLIERTVLITKGDFIEKEDFEQSYRMQKGEPDSGRLTELESMTLAEMERYMIEKTLVACNGNLSQAAVQLGMSRTSLYRRIEKYRIQR